MDIALKALTTKPLCAGWSLVIKTMLDAIADAATAPAADDMVIFEGVDASGNPDPNGPDSVKVPKVEVATTSGNKSYYAYWVEDEGVKADLEWNETLASDTSAAELEHAQARRLSASPGPDYGVLGGPFASGVTYPLKEGGSNSWLEDLEKAFSPADMGLVMGSTRIRVTGSRRTVTTWPSATAG